MGYAVGRICYATKEDATDVVMSQIPPSIGADGSFHQFVKIGHTWTYNNQIIHLSLPECDTELYYQTGIHISGAVIVILASIWCASFIYKFIGKINSHDDED